MENSTVVYRRIRGRIVPIRMKKDQRKDLAQGAGLLAGGIGTAVAGGTLSGRILRSAYKTGENIQSSVFAARDLTRKQLKMGVSKTRKLGQRSPKGQLTFQGLHMGSAVKNLKPFKLKTLASENILRHGAFGLGGILIGEGFARLYKGMTGKELSVPADVGASVAGVLSVKAAEAAFKKGLGKKALLSILSRGKIK